MRKIIVLFSAFMFIFLSNVSSSPTSTSIIFDDPSKIKELNYNLFILEDSLSILSISDILKNNAFQPSILSVPNLGVSNAVYWIKFSICNQTRERELLLQLSSPLMDIADLYYLDKNENYSVLKAGDTLPFFDRKYKNHNFIYDVSIPYNETRTFYLKIKATEQILVPLYLGTRASTNAANSFTDILVGMYIGIILVMFLYNTFIYITVKDINYLYYIIYILFIGLTQITLLGYSSKLLWPNNLWLANHGLYIVASLGSSAILIFMMSFLNMRLYTPKLVYGVYFIVFIYTIAIIAALTDNQNLSYNIIDVNGILLSFFALFVAIKITLKGYKPARYFLIAWAIFLIGVFVFVFRSFGILPYNNFTNYTMPAGSAIEVTLLSLALANRINIFKKEKEASQKLALETLKENERIILEQNVILESKVVERTTKLEETILNLKQTQSKLVDAEKMASLGQLTAGIAHELNNPINFVISSIQPLRRDLDDINSLIQKYEKINPESNLKEEMTKIDHFKKEIEYDYLKTEINTLLKGIDEGASRTSEIVKGLRIFSRIDEADLKIINITEGIDSTLALLNSKIADANISIVKNYAELPLIECFPGKLNQVFMNILSNAIQAIEPKKEAQFKGVLIITTIQKEDTVIIKFQDNGIGMKEETIKKVFEPFFTTKDVGKGTGLGMSISKSIIDDHNGTIDIKSALGEGTTFTITLPIHQHKN